MFSCTKSPNFSALAWEFNTTEELCPSLPGFPILPFIPVGSCPILAAKFKSPITIYFQWLSSTKFTALLPWTRSSENKAGRYHQTQFGERAAFSPQFCQWPKSVPEQFSLGLQDLLSRRWAGSRPRPLPAAASSPICAPSASQSALCLGCHDQSVFSFLFARRGYRCASIKGWGSGWVWDGFHAREASLLCSALSRELGHEGVRKGESCVPSSLSLSLSFPLSKWSHVPLWPRVFDSLFSWPELSHSRFVLSED